MTKRCALVVAATLLVELTLRAGVAATVTPGNILAAYGAKIYEVTTQGVVVQSFDVRAITPSSSRFLGDLVYDPAGYIHVRINAPWGGSLISSFNLATEQWIHTPVLIYESGGTDLEMFQVGNTLFTESNQFDLVTRTSRQITPTMHLGSPSDKANSLTLGRDGFFYATGNWTPATEIYRIDPITYEQIGDGLSAVNAVDRFPNVQGMAVKENGDYYVAAYDGRVFAFNNTGQFVGASAVIGVLPSDLSLSNQGLLAFGQSNVGSYDGTLAIFDPQLNVLAKVTFRSASLTDCIYTTFIEVPETSSPLLCLYLVGFGIIQRRTR